MTTIGIDLGTTNSVVAVIGNHEGKGVACGPVTVIHDDVKRLTQASAVCVFGDEVFVGDDAKGLAPKGFAPVRFVKKYMGTQETFRVGDEDWTAEKVSSKVLERMVWMAKEALSAPIKRAFVTHPAYFDALAIDATREAARMAGLDVDGRLMMEPVAAAMAFTYEDESPELRVLVYDLGGGTFDVTLVDRTSGSFTPLAFGGNRELGGYNFDKKIATRMLASLREKGYQINIDQDHPETDARWACLMHFAEQAKIEVCRQPNSTTLAGNVFMDDNDKAVQLSFALSRQEFEELIEPEIRETIEATWEVLEKGGIAKPGKTAEQRGEEDRELVQQRINHLVLVGGSSRIPMVQERLRAEFGLEPECSDDLFDLSVAVGAAMAAGAEGTVEGLVSLTNIPERSDDSLLVVSGKIQTGEGLDDPAGCIVTVNGGLDGEYQTQTGDDGGFYLEVDLFEDQENELDVSIESSDGMALFERTFQVHHDVDASAAPDKPLAALPKPISVDTDIGLVELAAENVQLPYKRSQAFQTVDELKEVPIDVYQEDIQLSTLILKGFSSPVPARTRLELELEIGEDYAMRITATVPSDDITKSQEIKLARPVIPDTTELKRQFAELQQTYRGQLDNMPDGDAKALATAEGDRLIDQISDMLNEEHPERMQIYMLMQKFKLQIKQMTDDLRPPKGDVEKDLVDARALLPKAIKEQPALADQELDRTLDLLAQQAMKAYHEKNADEWRRTSRKIHEIKESLDGVVNPVGEIDWDNFPPAPQVMAFVESEISRLQGEIGMGRYPGDDASARASLTQARTELAQVNLDQGNESKKQVMFIYMQHVRPIADAIGGDDDDPKKKTGIGAVIQQI